MGKWTKPFRFFTRLHLSELTSQKATNLEELVKILKKVSGSCIYHHTHRFLQQHQHLSPEPPNDFAYWVSGILGDEELGEKLASIDTIQFSSIRSLREKILDTIEDHLKKNPSARLKFADKGQEFHFVKSKSFIFPTPYTARNLGEFWAILRIISFDSIYFHIFESRLRMGKESNDFAIWMEESLGETGLAKEISKLDPYSYTLEDLRLTIIDLIGNKLHEKKEKNGQA